MNRFIAQLCLVGCLGLLGCVTNIVPGARYSAMVANAPAPTKALALRVVDNREVKLGGREKNLVGQARGGYGNPFGVRESRPDTVTNLAFAATSDALLQSGVSIRDAGGPTLVATVKKYWADGYSNYKAEMEVLFELTAPDGKTLWRSLVRAEQTGKLGAKPTTRMRKLYEDMLGAFARNATTEFKTPAFREAAGLALSPAGFGTGAKLYSRDGTYFGDLVGVLGDNVVVNLASGVRATISVSQAAEMLAPGTAKPLGALLPETGLHPGTKLYAASGALVGEVAGINGDNVTVDLQAGGATTLTRAQALEMMKER